MKAKRFEIKDTGVPAMPKAAFLDGEEYTRGTLAFSYMARLRTSSAFDSVVEPLVHEINAPGGIVNTPAGPRFAIEQGHKAARVAHERYLTDEGCSMKAIKGRGGKAVSRPRNAVKYARATAGARSFVEALREQGLFEGQNFAALLGWHELSDAERAVVLARDRGARGDHRHDSGGEYRFGATPHNLRTEDVLCRDQVQAAMAGQPNVVRLIVRLISANALRARREACGLTMYGLHKGGAFGRPRAYSFNKGDRDEPTKLVHMEGGDWSDLLAYIGGERAAVDPRGRDLAYWRELSRRATFGDEAAELELRAAQVFLTPMGRDMTYDNLLNTYVGPALRAAGVDASLHKLRHDYCYRRLREIEAMDVPVREKRAKRARLAREMGWSPKTAVRMFKVYDAYEEEQRRIADQIAFNERLARGVAAAQQLRDAPEDRPVVAPFVARPSAASRRFFSQGRRAAA